MMYSNLQSREERNPEQDRRYLSREETYDLYKRKYEKNKGQFVRKRPIQRPRA
jgi:hypothetical protein